MKEYEVNGKTYKLPGSLTDFQKKMYIHLIDWKWANKDIPNEPGLHSHTRKNKDGVKETELIPYDTMFPQDFLDKNQLYPLYQPVLDRFKEHMKRFPFKLHPMSKHMASSQIACVNLFLPIMQHPKDAVTILSEVMHDMGNISTDRLDEGFQIEFWDGKGNEKGVLGDHCARSGTDSDFAIAYRDCNGDECLWLIEHKLTEQEFTECGGAKSDNNKNKDACKKNLAAKEGPEQCYYNYARKFNYWKITEDNPEFFPPASLQACEECPFKGGMNQLWRNMLLARAIEKSPDFPYKKVYFSVATHPDNEALNDSIEKFQDLINDEERRFFPFTSEDIIRGAEHVTNTNKEIGAWSDWYKDLYSVNP